MTKALEILGDGLELIGKLLKNKSAERTVDDAAEVLDAIEHAYDAMMGPINGAVTFEDAQKELARLRSDISVNNTAADAALDGKFPKD